MLSEITGVAAHVRCYIAYKILIAYSVSTGAKWGMFFISTM